MAEDDMRDRLKEDLDDIRNLDDLIEAREEEHDNFSDDIDSLERDLEIPEDIDPDHALTFPHPKDHHGPDLDHTRLGAPSKEDIEFDFQDSAREMEPPDYEQAYSYALDTHAVDAEEEYISEVIQEAGEVEPEDLIEEVQVVELPSPGGFRAAEAIEEERLSGA